MVSHQILRQFEWNGMIFGGVVTPESLERINRIKLTSRDVLIAAYCKSGMVPNPYNA